jgi:ketosteroid isomerase-like protein
MSQENLEIVRRVYASDRRGDRLAWLALIDPQVEWDTTRLASEGITATGLYRGHEGVRQWFSQWNEAWQDSQFALDELIEAGEEVVAVVTRTGRGRVSGVEVQTQGAVVWTIRGGKVARAVLFPTRVEALEAVRLSE